MKYEVALANGKSVSAYITTNLEVTQKDQDYISGELYKLSHYLIDQSIKNSPEFQNRQSEEKVKLLELFNCPIYVEEIPSEYYKLGSWYVVTTKLGRIKIGWRKRVINIDWSDSDIKVNGEDFFCDQDVTKDQRYIHAWSYEKAKEYLDKLGVNNA